MHQTLIIIKTAQISDVDNIRGCAKLAYQHYIERMQQTPAPMLADFEHQVDNGYVSIALSGTTFVGYVVCYPKGECLHLENVAVHPSHHGKGIGKQLIKYAEQQAKTLGLNCVELYTNEKMHENLTIYPHLGYIEIGRKSEDGFNRVFFSKKV